ncbi:MAG: bifunctional folylpolyglutamate synthase/dihydrofolate synthase, partial [Elusimicrobia bacterium]|nr:bifunctional folylpolyglutamate synthase/dihydrofolate synthase [Elusimicrobiota bacterium]
MNYSAALKALEARRETRVELGLARVRRVLKILGNPQEAYSSIHVAGTNGKGSVCAMLESVLRHAGYGTGLYLSPHLWSVRERIQVRGRMISHKDFGLALAAVFLAEKKARTRMTYFELLTCAAFWHFRRSGVRAAVLETGLGGRLDATNIVRSPSVCVISSVDFDHMEFLGSTLGQIAREKAGIIKRGRP